MREAACLGPEGDPFAEKCAALLSRFGPYDVLRRDGFVAFRLPPQYHRPFALLRTTNWLNRAALSQFTMAGIQSSPAIREIDKFHIDPSSIPSLPALLAKYEGIQLFERIARLVFYPSIAQLPQVLCSGIAPSFFGSYPNGRVLAVWGDQALHSALAILRVMGAAIDLADRNFEELERIGPFRMLSHAQSAGVFYAGKHLSIPVAMLLPRLYAFAASKVIIGFVFLLGDHIPDVRKPYPRSGLEFVRSEASGLFRQDLDIAVEDVTPDAIDRFTLLSPAFTSDDIRTFVRQYLRNLSLFLRYVVDPCHFRREKGSEWIGLSHYRAWLSFERIADEVLLMLTDDTSYLRKAALFRILDQLASLKTSNEAAQAGAFRQLLLPQAASPDPIGEGVALYKGVVGSHLSELLRRVREELVAVALDSIYVPGVVDRANRTVTLRDGRVMDPEHYAASLVRELRNTEHAYYTRNFDHILAISTGDTPESLPALGLLAYLALVARPDLFILRKW